MSKTVYRISCSMVCKIVFCSKFPDIQDNAGKVTKRRRRRTQAIAKRYAFTQMQLSLVGKKREAKYFRLRQ